LAIVIGTLEIIPGQQGSSESAAES